MSIELTKALQEARIAAEKAEKKRIRRLGLTKEDKKWCLEYEMLEDDFKYRRPRLVA